MPKNKKSNKLPYVHIDMVSEEEESFPGADAPADGGSSVKVQPFAEESPEGPSAQKAFAQAQPVVDGFQQKGAGAPQQGPSSHQPRPQPEAAPFPGYGQYPSEVISASQNGLARHFLSSQVPADEDQVVQIAPFVIPVFRPSESPQGEPAGGKAPMGSEAAQEARPQDSQVSGQASNPRILSQMRQDPQAQHGTLQQQTGSQPAIQPVGGQPFWQAEHPAQWPPQQQTPQGMRAVQGQMQARRQGSFQPPQGAPGMQAQYGQQQAHHDQQGPSQQGQRPSQQGRPAFQAEGGFQQPQQPSGQPTQQLQLQQRRQQQQFQQASTQGGGHSAHVQGAPWQGQPSQQADPRQAASVSRQASQQIGIQQPGPMAQAFQPAQVRQSPSVRPSTNPTMQPGGANQASQMPHAGQMGQAPHANLTPQANQASRSGQASGGFSPQAQASKGSPQPNAKQGHSSTEGLGDPLLDAKAIEESPMFNKPPVSIEEGMRKSESGRKMKRRVLAAVLAVAVLAAVGAGVFFVLSGQGGMPQSGGNGPSAPASQQNASGQAGSGSSSSSSASSSGSASSGGDLSGTVVYQYSANTASGVEYKVEETVSFQSNGDCESSKMDMTFPDEASAKTFTDNLARDYGASFKLESLNGANAVVTIDNSGLHLSRDEYENALRYSVDDLVVLKK